MRSRNAQKTDQRALSALAEREWVVEFARYARGDPRLSAWEEGFVTDLQHLAERKDAYSRLPDDYRLSADQVAKLMQIADKVHKPIPEDFGDPEFLP